MTKREQSSIRLCNQTTQEMHTYIFSIEDAIHISPTIDKLRKGRGLGYYDAYLNGTFRC